MLLLSTLLMFGCSKQESTQAEITRRQSEIDLKVATEVAQIAAEKTRLDLLTQQKRALLVAELAQRTEKIEEQQRAMAQNIAAEQLRRETVAAEIRDYVDSLTIISGQVDAKPRVLIGNQIAPEGFVLVCPSGATVKYSGRDEGYFVFTYTEEAFSLSLKRMTKGLSIVTWLSNKQMPDGSVIKPASNRLEHFK
jgi:hypothetical protein